MASSGAKVIATVFLFVVRGSGETFVILTADKVTALAAEASLPLLLTGSAFLVRPPHAFDGGYPFTPLTVNYGRQYVINQLAANEFAAGGRKLNLKLI